MACYVQYIRYAHAGELGGCTAILHLKFDTSVYNQSIPSAFDYFITAAKEVANMMHQSV